jgi:hypothetical protein
MRYICPMCGSEHSGFDQAVGCCIDKIETHTMYRCPRCADMHFSADEAVSCCGIDTMINQEKVNEIKRRLSKEKTL